jgi:hypothetical protein
VIFIIAVGDVVVDICLMNVYKVAVENNVVVSAAIADYLEHGDIGINPAKKTIQWLAIECEDEKIAIEVAKSVVESVWKGM